MTWHMTCDMFGGVNILSKFQLPSSYGLWLMILWISGGKGWDTESVNHKAVYRTAPATPGLLKSCFLLYIFQKGVGDPIRIQKFWSFGVVFLGFLSDIFNRRGGRLNPFQKFWGSFLGIFRYFLGCFELVFGGMFSLSLFKRNLPQRCPKQGGRGGQGHFWTMSKRKQFFFSGLLP